MEPTLDVMSSGSVILGQMGGAGAFGVGATGASPGLKGTAGKVGTAAPVVQFQ
jgi:hypothetical protein